MGSQTLRAAAAWIELGKLPEVSRSTTAGRSHRSLNHPESGSWQEVRLVHTITQARNPNREVAHTSWTLGIDRAVGMSLLSSLMPKIYQNLLNKSVMCW